MSKTSGLIESRRRRQTGLVVSIYDGEAAGMDTANGEYPYSTVCENHSFIVCHQTLTVARRHASDPLGWCEYCNGYEG